MSEKLQHHTIVRQEHLNQYGYLFGGTVLAIIDELAFVACSRAYPGKNFVTRAVRNAEFTAPAGLGDLLQFDFGIESVGHTSVGVRVTVTIRAGARREERRSFDGLVVMVCVNEHGEPVPIEPPAVV
jgi:acyl-CoA hydrolase